MSDQVPGLPGIIPDEQLDQVKDYLSEQIDLAHDERAWFMQKIEKWRRQAEARPEQERKTHPNIENPSNVCVPLTQTAINGTYAQYKRDWGATRPLFNVKPVSGIDQRAADYQLRQAKAIELMIDALCESKNHINIRKKNQTILYDGPLLGTQFVRVRWNLEQWNYKRRGSTGEIETVSQVVKNTPEVVPIRFEDFLTRPWYENEQTCPWVAVVHHLFEHELDQRVAQGIYDEAAVENVKAFVKNELPEDREAEMRRRGIDAKNIGMFDIYEIFFRWDVDGDGFTEEVIWFYEPSSGEILREEFNDLGKRPILSLKHFGFPWSIYGMGIGWMGEHMQDETDALHNIRIDSMKFSMLPFIAVRRGSGVGPNETFEMGKIFEMADPKADFMATVIPSIAQYTMPAETYAKQWADRAMGTPDSMMGFEDQQIKTRATYGGTALLFNQASSLKDAIKETTREGYSELGELIFYHLVRQREDVERSLLHLIPEEYHPDLLDALSIEPHDIPLKFSFQVKVTEQDETEDMKRQAMLTFTQLYMTFYQQLFQILPLAYDPSLPVVPEVREVAAKAIIGGSKMMDMILQHFGFEDTTDYVPDTRMLEMMVDAIEMQRTLQLGVMNAARGRIAGGGSQAGAQPGRGPGAVGAEGAGA